MNNNSLFTPIVPTSKLHPIFDSVKNRLGYDAARIMMDEIYSTFHDGDGNFLEQFQTTGFNARIFELYLYAYFSQCGFSVNQTYDRPDFLIQNNDVEVCVEVTTINPSSNPIFRSRKLEELSQSEIPEIQLQELPIRFGSPLFSKLKKKYWDLPHVKGKPLVIAVQAFHDESSLFFSSSGLGTYLYGKQALASRKFDGSLDIRYTKIETHKLGEKEIPSNFFAQDDAEHISAILFTNSGTAPKFLRMGYQLGHHKGDVKVLVSGNFYNPDPKADKPLSMSYDLSEPPFTETWGQGVEVFYNPNALNPLPKDYFPDVMQHYIENETFYSDKLSSIPHPMASITRVIAIKDDTNVPACIEKISLHEFNQIYELPRPLLLANEVQWYKTSNNSLLGIVLHDLTDDDYGYVILKASKDDDYDCIDTCVSHETIGTAQEKLLESLSQMV